MKYFLLDTRNKNKCILSTEDPEEAANVFYEENGNIDMENWGDITLFSLCLSDREIKKIDPMEVFKLYH